MDATADMTTTGNIIGTPLYFAPELTLGRKAAVTTATDVYGLGAILYALLTGRAPFQADSVWELIEKVRDQPPEPPRRHNPKADVDLQTICLKCLEKDPGSRYPTPATWPTTLSSGCSGAPIHARPSNWRHRVWLWCRHPARQRDAGLYAVVIGLMLTVWAVAGISGIALGMIEIPFPRAIMFQVSLFLFLGYLQMVWLGCRAAAGKTWAIRAGLVHSAPSWPQTPSISWVCTPSAWRKLSPRKTPPCVA